MTWEEYLNSDYNKITDSTTISYNNKQFNVNDYINKEKREDEWYEHWNPTYLFASDINASFNNLPDGYYDKNNIYNYFDSLESEIMDSSQGCYDCVSCRD